MKRFRIQCVKEYILEVWNVELMFFAQFSTKFNRFKEIWFVGSSQFIADVVTKDFSVPVFLWRWFPRNFQSILVHNFNLHSSWGTSGCYEILNSMFNEHLSKQTLNRSIILGMIVTVSERLEDPTSFSATRQKWYIVAGTKLETPATVCCPKTRTRSISAHQSSLLILYSIR